MPESAYAFSASVLWRSRLVSGRSKDISRALVRLTDLFASKDSYTREQPLATDPLVSIVINKLEISFSHLKYCDISQGTTLSVPRFRNTEKARDGLTVVQATI